MNRPFAVFLLATFTGHLLAQSPTSFEVASIRPNTSNAAVGSVGGAGGASIAVRVQGSAQTLADLASLLSRAPVLGAPVLDRTGLKGSFDFELTYAPERPGADAPRGPGDPPSLFVAIEEQLGLRLQRTHGGVDVLVIDRLEPLAKE